MMEVDVVYNGQAEKVEWKMDECRKFKNISTASCLKAQGDFGNFVFEILSGYNYSIWLNEYTAFKDIEATIQDPRSFLGLILALKNGMLYSVEGISETILEEKQYCAGFIPKVNVRTTLKKQHNHVAVNVNYSLLYFKRLVQLYPELDELMIAIPARRTIKLKNRILYASEEMLNIVDKIFDNEYSGAIRQLYTDYKIGELLVHSIDRLCKSNVSLPGYNTRDVTALYEVKQLITLHFYEQLTQKRLAKQAGMNITKLKRGFKSLFKVTIFQYVTRIRMEKAGELLVNTEKSIGIVAEECGYNNTSAFIAAFKKMYGVTPLDYRRRRSL